MLQTIHNLSSLLISPEPLKIVIIGGGAAGFFAAIHAAGAGNQVVLLEKSNKVLAKVKVSGGGRCNVTNSCPEPSSLIKNYPRGSKELLGPFTVFGPVQTIDWFENIGVTLKTEPDGRMFPETDSSQTIIDCLVKKASGAGVELKQQVSIQKIERSDIAFKLVLADGGSITADKIIIASGGGPKMKSYEWLQELGHTIIPPVPSLFTFNIPNNSFQDLMGLSIADVIIKIAGTSYQQQGPMLFTHWGLSGPAVLKLSAWAARWMADQHYQFIAMINFFPEFKEQQLRDALQNEIKLHPLKKAAGQGFKIFPSRLWARFCSLAGIGKNQKWNETSKKSINKLVQLMTCLELHVKGKTTFKEEFVTCGGVSLKDVNMKTMESKKVPGLYFAGEVLDIDGVTGGFNFQAAWTTGYISGTSASGKKNTNYKS